MTVMTTKKYAEAARLWQHGSTSEVIGQIVGCSASTIKNIARNNRDDFPPRKRMVTNAEKARIRELRSQGLTQMQIAHTVHRSRSMIQVVLAEAKEKESST